MSVIFSRSSMTLYTLQCSPPLCDSSRNDDGWRGRRHTLEGRLNCGCRILAVYARVRFLGPTSSFHIGSHPDLHMVTSITAHELRSRFPCGYGRVYITCQ